MLQSYTATAEGTNMESAGYGKSGVGMMIGLLTAVIAVFAFLAGRQNARTKSNGRYEGWYDSLGI